MCSDIPKSFVPLPTLEPDPWGPKYSLENLPPINPFDSNVIQIPQIAQSILDSSSKSIVSTEMPKMRIKFSKAQNEKFLKLYRDSTKWRGNKLRTNWENIFSQFPERSKESLRRRGKIIRKEWQTKL